MPTLPAEFSTVLGLFANLFSAAVWPQAQALLVGTVLAHGPRTVTAALRALGLDQEQHFVNYHRVLNRAVWSSRQASGRLLQLLVATFVPDGPIIIGADDTLERRRGEHITARGFFRDAVRSSRSRKVTASGLRWLTLMLVTPIPFAQRVWALPFLTILAQAEAQSGKTLTDQLRQGLAQVRRWLPERQIVCLADGSYACLDLLWPVSRWRQPITMIVRFRLDAALFGPLPVPAGRRRGQPRKRGPRLPKLTAVLTDPATVWTSVSVPSWYGQRPRTIELASATAIWSNNGQPCVPIRWVLIRDPEDHFKSQALASTQTDLTPRQIVDWYVRRWPLEVTYHEVREHLGVETQRQWSDLAIARTTPALFGLYSLVTVQAHRLAADGQLLVHRTAWYPKALPTFSDALAAVRQQLAPTPDTLRPPLQPDLKIFLAQKLDGLLQAATCIT